MTNTITNPIDEAELPPSAIVTVNLREVAATHIFTAIPPDVLTTSLATAPFIPVEGALNLRDLGLLPTSPLKPGLLYRSGSLHNISAHAMAQLRDDLGVRTIFDLRHDKERDEHPEPEIDGVHSVWCRTNTPPARIDPASFEAEEGLPGFLSMYKNLLMLYAPEYKRILEFLRDHPGQGILWHCTAGKDRAGLLAMMLLALAGADAQTIGYDYSLTRIGVERDRETLQANMEKWLGGDAVNKPGFANMASTRPEIAEAVVEMVGREWGGFRGFCGSVIGLCEKDLDIIVRSIRK